MTSTVENDNASTVKARADDALIALRKVEEDCGFSKASIYRMMARGEFPKPAKRAGRSVRWLRSEVQQWVRNEWRPQAPT
ncbi:TPA: helix-turn-helix transcriptional regulator [Stenotrophomonas maltophilia]|uniref:helix-turn-helix transcriptional regulator n=1 Tax=Stenotrophomonas maltophilia TaxID=40324 RepID=UPI0013FE2A41|nr:AlpA family phage regulatory protein [Stenotrophomonas maltophilia]HDS1011397.1 AlpA family phage regulatory protein [Stenotrophomonas maltophilia]HDS1020207.1 AlpA family phage regulatory protein [Stenotrophomonas maltophilia]